MKSTKKNTNVLAGIRCPTCGSYGPFNIEATAWFRVDDDGSDTFIDMEWDDDRHMVCVACGAGGTVGKFTLPKEERNVEQ